MCVFGGSAPAPQAAKPVAAAPTAASVTSSDSVKMSRDYERKRQAAAMSQLATNPTGGQGVTAAAAVSKKKLLGE